jgi:hypothetical protein
MAKKNIYNKKKRSKPFSLRLALKKTVKKTNNSRQNYTPDLIPRALNDITNNGLSQRKTAEKYDIPLSTLNDALNKVHSSHTIGRKPILNQEIEEVLNQILIRISDVGVGLNKYEILKAIRNYLIKNNLRNGNGEPLFKDNIPTDKWYTGFIKRHPMLSQRIAKNLAMCRSKNYTYEIAEEWYKSVAMLYNELWPDGKVPATHLWNSDESGYSGHQGSHLIVCKKGTFL